MKKNALSFFAFFFYSFIASGQPFAVEANLQLQAPLTPYLSDIVSGAPSKIQVQLLLRDDDELSYSARLHFTISGQGISIRTRQDISPPPIFLDYNVPVLLSGLDLFDYFQLDQLEFQGISPQDFLQQGGRLPEGVYNICVEVLDYNRFQGAAVSNQACTVVELSEWDPPLITSPIADVPQQAAQNILFQWIPQHLGSFPVSYRFRLWEQREGLSVNQILQQTLPLYETQQLSSTSLLYGTDAPPLFAGQSYIVQVQAQDILGQQQFKNEGRSQHLIFTYGSETINTLANDDDLCTIRPQSLAASALTIDGFMAHWEALPNVDHYAFSLAQDSAFLFPLLEYQDIPVIENQYRVQSLEEGIYYYRIRAIYENCESPFSTVIPVRLGQGCLPLTEDMSEYSCGTATDPLNFEPSSLLEYLRVEDTIRAHDFKVVLQDVRGQGSFSGQGYVQVPYLQQAQVNVQFEGIKVDEYCRLVAGKMEVTGAGLAIISTDLAATIDSILGALEILEAGLAEVEDILEDAADFLAELEDIEDYLANGQSVLENLLHLEEHFPYLPQEATDAIQAAIDCLKNAQNADDFEACKAQMLAAIDQLKTAMESLYDADFRVNFGPVSPSQFGFDSIRHIAQAELYHKIPIAETDYWVPWQSLPSQQAGQVKAWAPSQSTFPEDIQFKDGLKQSIPIVDSQTASDKTLQLQGQGHEQSQTVYALQPYQDSLGKEQVHIAGQLNLISYTPKTVKVVLVPVNGTQYPHSIEALRQQLDHIFGQAIVDIDLRVHTNLLLPEFDNQMDSVPSGFLANYTDEMQLIRNRFKAENTIVEDTYYLFLVESSQDPSKLGYMPKKKPFGFIYHQSQTTEAQYTKTIAHELAHGAFHLSHSFQDSPALPPGETDNLMDYAQGLHLQKYQWDLIHNPAVNWTLFDGDEEGESVIVNTISMFDDLRNSDGTLTFMAPSGKPITLPPNVDGVVFNTGDEINVSEGCFERFDIYPFGSLRAFKIKDKFYSTSIICGEEGLFAGYKLLNAEPIEYYEDTYTNRLSTEDQKAIVGFPCFESDQLTYQAGNIDFDQLIIPEDLSTNDHYKANGKRQVFDFILEAQVSSPIEFDGQAYPSYTPLATEFLRITGNTTNCGERSSLFAFVHAHQIAKYPELFQYCSEKLTQDITLESLKAEMKRKYNILTSHSGSYLPSLTGIVSEEEIFTALEYKKWQSKDASLYKRYKAFIDGEFTSNFFNQLEENSAGADQLLDYFEDWKGESCYFEFLSIEDRIKALRVLKYSGLSGKFLFGLVGSEEENIYNYILGSTPLKDFPKILQLFASNKYQLYYEVEDLMWDSWRPQGNAPHGYEYFVNILSYMVLHSKPYQATCNSLTSGDHFCIINDFGNHAHTIAQNPTLGTQHYYKVDYTDPSILSGRKIVLKSAHLSAPALAQPEQGLNWVTSTGMPFEYIGLYFSYDMEFTLPSGQNINVAKGNYLVVPFCWADWYFRKMNSAIFNHRFRVIGDIIAIGTLPLTLGSSTLATGWKILSVADGIYGAADLFVFAPDSYSIDLGGGSLLSRDLHQIWDRLGLALAAASITGLVSTNTNGVKNLVLQNVKKTWKHINDNVPNAAARVQTMDQLRSALKETLKRLNSATQEVNLSSLNKLKNHIKAEITSLDLNSKLTNFSSDFSVHVKQSFWAILMRGNIEYSIARGVFLDDIYHLQPNKWIITPQQELIHIGDIDKVRYIPKNGIPTEGDIALYRDPVTETILVLDKAANQLASRLKIAGANDELILHVLNLEFSKATALTDNLVDLGGDYLRAFNESALGDGGMVGAWEVLKEGITSLTTSFEALSITRQLLDRGFVGSQILESFGQWGSKFNISNDLTKAIYKVKGFAELVLDNHPLSKAIENVSQSHAIIINGRESSNFSEALLKVIEDDGSMLLKEIKYYIDNGIALRNQPASTNNQASKVAEQEAALNSLLRDRGFGLEPNTGYIRSYFSTGIFNSAVYPEHIPLSATELQQLKALGQIQNGSEIGTKNYAKILVDGQDFSRLSGTPGITSTQELYTSTFNHPIGTVRVADSEVKGLQDILDSGIDLNGKTIEVSSMRPVCPSCNNVIKALKEQFPSVEIIIKEGKFPPN